MNETEISVRNFSVYADNHQILKNISVDIPKNQITAIIGPSGCGKTTLLRSMNRMIDHHEHVCSGLRIHGIRDRAVMNQKAEQCLKSVGLWNEVHDRLNDSASKLSLGQQQRLCLARALAVEPEILLCDETTSALDPVSAKHIENELLTLKKDYSIIFVTHVLRQAKRLADYVIFLYLGELVEHGPASEVFTQPRDPRTKAYLEGVFG
jgi:phosphate transport system ATP-binding protein